MLLPVVTNRTVPHRLRQTAGAGAATELLRLSSATLTAQNVPTSIRSPTGAVGADLSMQ